MSFHRVFTSNIGRHEHLKYNIDVLWNVVILEEARLWILAGANKELRRLPLHASPPDETWLWAPY
jgi:hypothetical protein